MLSVAGLSGWQGPSQPDDWFESRLLARYEKLLPATYAAGTAAKAQNVTVATKRDAVEEEWLRETRKVFMQMEDASPDATLPAQVPAAAPKSVRAAVVADITQTRTTRSRGQTPAGSPSVSKVIKSSVAIGPPSQCEQKMDVAGNGTPALGGPFSAKPANHAAVFGQTTPLQAPPSLPVATTASDSNHLGAAPLPATSEGVIAKTEALASVPGLERKATPAIRFTFKAGEDARLRRERESSTTSTTTPTTMSSDSPSSGQYETAASVSTPASVSSEATEDYTYAQDGTTSP